MVSEGESLYFHKGFSKLNAWVMENDDSLQVELLASMVHSIWRCQDESGEREPSTVRNMCIHMFIET